MFCLEVSFPCLEFSAKTRDIVHSCMKTRQEMTWAWTRPNTRRVARAGKLPWPQTTYHLGAAWLFVSTASLPITLALRMPMQNH
jgi:hypothetical protein